MEVEIGYSEMRNNRPLYERFGAHFDAVGDAPGAWDSGRDLGSGSTDMGDVSQVCPAIHPYVAICDPGEAGIHQRRFAEMAAERRGLDATVRAASAMARTMWDYLSDPTLRGAVQEAWGGAESDDGRRS